MMPVTVQSAHPVPGPRLSAPDAADAAELARLLCGTAGARLDDPSWVAAARQSWEDLPAPVRQPLRDFRRRSGPYGVLLLRGLPVDPGALPPTPQARDSVQREATVPAALLLMFACGLGDPVAFRPEKAGALVQDVVPVPGMEEFQGNAGSAVLSFHTENAFHPHRPDHVLLLCLRADHDRVAGLRVSCVRQVRGLLSEEAGETLFQPEFATGRPPSFGPDGGPAPAHAILTGAGGDPDLCVDLAATTGLTPRAQRALRELSRLLDRTAVEVRMEPGDLVVVDNRVTVHGRSGFRPRYDGADRWLQRAFVAADLRRSRALRPDDGYVVTG